MRVERISYSGLTIVSKLNSKLIGNLLYIRNVEKITEINNKKITSSTIRKYHNMYETYATSYFIELLAEMNNFFILPRINLSSTIE
jgi:hypothetical protein